MRAVQHAVNLLFASPAPGPVGSPPAQPSPISRYKFPPDEKIFVGAVACNIPLGRVWTLAQRGRGTGRPPSEPSTCDIKCLLTAENKIIVAGRLLALAPGVRQAVGVLALQTFVPFQLDQLPGRDAGPGILAATADSAGLDF